jgi:hypothetical protein
VAKRVGKKRNKVDPILQLAEKNKRNSLAAQEDSKNKKIEKNQKQKSHNWQAEEDPFIANLDADKLFREMKRRDF